MPVDLGRSEIIDIKRRVEENDSSAAVQKRFLADQDLEKLRINVRFDEELVKLKQLWAMAGGEGAAAVTTPANGVSSAKNKP